MIARRVAKQALNRNIETKQSNVVYPDGQEVKHNNFVSLTGALIQTAVGTADPMVGVGSRIGDEINLKGVSIRAMIELNERYSDVTFRMMVVKAAKGDTPDYSTLFQGISANKMLDRFNTERYTILSSKIFKMKAPGLSVAGDGAASAQYITSLGTATSGIYVAGDAGSRSYNVLSRATKIVKMWIPGTKFSRSGVIKYENGSAQPKFFDYHVLLFAYANYSTSSGTSTIDWFVGRVNDFVSTMYFKDG
jgi:hypothetical protein